MAKKQEKKPAAQGFGNMAALIKTSKNLNKPTGNEPSAEDNENLEALEEPVVSETTEKPKKPNKSSTVKKKSKDEVTGETDLYELGISHKDKSKGSYTYEEFKKIFGSNWQDGAFGNDFTNSRVDNRHHRILGEIAKANGVDKTTVLNNILNDFRYANWDYIKKLMSENIDIDM